MKYLVLLTFILSTPFAQAMSVSKRKVEDLERRVAILEQKIQALSGEKSTTGLRVKDSKNTIIQASPGRGIASSPQLNKEQQAEIMKQIESFKKSQAGSQKLLDELMNEDF